MQSVSEPGKQGRRQADSQTVTQAGTGKTTNNVLKTKQTYTTKIHPGGVKVQKFKMKK